MGLPPAWDPRISQRVRRGQPEAEPGLVARRRGYGPNFSEGAKAVSVGLDADYQNTYTASISYTDFFGGNYNPINDRDFLAVSFGVNF